MSVDGLGPRLAPNMSSPPPPQPALPPSRCRHSTMPAIAPQKQRSLSSASVHVLLASIDPTDTKFCSNTGFEWGRFHGTSLRTCSRFPGTLLMPRTTILVLITRMGHWARITATKEKYKNEPGSGAGVFFGWLAVLYTFAIHRVESSTANLPSTTSSTKFSTPSLFIYRLCSPATR